MAPPIARRPGSFLAGVVVTLVALGAACGDDTVSTNEAVEALNRQIEARGVRLDCPEEVDKGNREFDCQLQGTKTGKTTTVRMATPERGSDVLDTADGAAFRNAVEEVTRP